MLKLQRLVLLCGLLLLVVIPALAQEAATVSLGSSEELGSYLVGPNGMTLYLFSPDPLNDSVCYDKCATNWPPLIVESTDKLTTDEGIPGDLGTITRKDGTLQVTYNGIALYYWVKDTKVGDTTGNRVGNVWWIVPPATVYAQAKTTLGTILVGPKGLSLYLFTKDTPGVSNCYDKCATNWPPLLVESADAIVPGVNLLGKFGTTERTDGTLQVTYNDMPLYYWKDDKVPGDVSGEGVGDVWYTIAPESVGVSNTKDLGDFLIAWNGMTLYMFTKDTAGVSNCSGDCLKNWPALTVDPANKLVGTPGMKGKLGTLKRDDGSMQVTYNDMPLYYWKDDKAPGDTTGQKVGDVWFVVAP